MSVAVGGCTCLEAHACRIFALGQTQHSQAHGELAGRIHAEVVMALAPTDFHKSMTTPADHRIWQDVYRPMTAAGRV
ncbi:type II toxin-antitoxin system MqsR family toxin [Sulfuritalea sp.]|uniref:type II toxin-antitoxin system MqsR family toxin n=1 Tax=Sulfuritalea sp. TaxID=2480090 RepID=UPI001AC4E19A|nr:type II toxin-antitoxin system MqsR family toxin [Sulfuritalea sp.]MBN8473612.1 type II toxin-antitoxin system MqsR family toxin [Sulfuritalea sp.]